MEQYIQNERSFLYKTIYCFHFLIRTILVAILTLLIGIFLVFTIYYGDLLFNVSFGKAKAPLFSAYVIATPSMTPSIHIKDAIIVKRLDHDDYNVGDIITYASTDTNYAGKMITHRIVKKENVGTNNSNYVTKGDNNTIPDVQSVNTSDIYGKVVLMIPKIGYIQDFFSKPSNYFLCLLIPALIFLFYDVIRILFMLKQKKAY